MKKKQNNSLDLEFRSEWLLSHHKTEKNIKIDSDGDEYIEDQDSSGHVYRTYLPFNAKKN